MATAEVVAFVASDTYGWPPSHHSTKTGLSLKPLRRRHQGDHDATACLNLRLRLIAETWVNLRSPTQRDFRPRPSPKPSNARRLPQLEPDVSPSNLPDPTTTDSKAQRRSPDAHPSSCDVPTAGRLEERRRRGNDSDCQLLRDPSMDLIDFDSDEGFFQAAGKKKKKQTTTFNWLDDEGDKKDGDGAEEGGDGNKDQNDGAGGGSGSTGGDGGDGENKKDDDNKDEIDNNDDIWDFAPAGNKKKNKKKSPDGTDAFGLPDIPSTDFHEIKLDDGGGGQPDDLDLGLIPKAEKITAGLTAWTSSWTTGSWGWGGLKSPGGSDIPKPVEEDKPKSSEAVEDNPWGINRGKPKKQTTTFNFGSFDEGESKTEDSFDFLAASEPKEKKDVGAFTWGMPAAKTADDDFWGKIGDKTSMDDKSKEEEKAADAEASDDIWGFSSSKKDKKKKNKIAVVEETPISEEPPPEAPEPPQATNPADNAISEAEAALIAEEEAELRKLQTKKDIGSKLTKKQQDRLKILTENAKTREEAAATAAAAESKVEDTPPTIGDESIEQPASDVPAPPEGEDSAQIEADEKALIIQEEEDEMYILRSKKKLKKSEKDRLRVLEERADDRAREAEEAAAAEEQEKAVPEVIDAAEAPAEDPPVDTIDSAQAEADEKARIIRDEEDELAELRSKKKLKKSDKERLRILEERADDRAREAEDAAADQSVPESNGDATEPKTEETVPTSADDAFGDDSAAQAETDEAARLIEEEEFEMELLLSKNKLKKPEKARLKELQDNKERREQETADKAAAGAGPEAADAVESSPADDAPAGGDSADVENSPTNEEDDLAAKIIEEEEMELEILLSKSKLKKADKARLKVLQDNKEQREWEAAQKAETTAEAPPAEDQPAVEESAPEEAPVDHAALEKEKEAALIAAEEDELSDLLAKAKLKKAEKARLKELKDRKDQREWEAAQTAEAEVEAGPEAPPAEDSMVVDDTPPAPEDPMDEAALQKENEDAEIAAEEQELCDLLSKIKPKKAEKARLKELQDRKDKRDEEIRLAAEQAEQEARELEEQKKREQEEKAAAELAAEIAAEEAEISSLESKKKLKKSEKERLAELKFRRDERASAEAAKLANDLMKEDAENDIGTKDEAQPLSWADDDPAKDNGGGDDWMNWGGLTSSSKAKKSKEESVPVPPAADPEPETKVEGEDTWGAWGTSKKEKKKKSKGTNLIEFGGNDDNPAVPDPPPVPEASGFDFGWGKPTPKDEPVDDIWGFGSGSKKKKSKNAGAEVVDDTNLASTVVPDPISATKDKGEDDFWSTFGSKKSKDKKSGSSSKEDLVAEPPLPPPSPVGMDLTATEEVDIDGKALGDLSESTELSKSKLSEKESKKSSSLKEPKLSKKELEKIEKEKKKAEKEQKAREEQEAKDAAELARLEEEERLEAEAKAEAERLAQEEADRIRKEEEEKQAALDAIAKEEADLAVLQAKKDSGKKLLKKEKEKYDKLFASCQARAEEKAAQEAAEQAARDEAERLQREAEEQARKEAIEKEESELKDLQKKKDSGRKLLKKDKDRYEVLSANKKARRQAEKDAEAAKTSETAIDEPAAADEPNLVDPLEKDLAKLDVNELDELDAFLSAPPKAAPTSKAAEVDPFSFWGASKKPTSSSKKGKSSATEPVSPCNPREPQHISFPHHQFSASALALAFNSSQSAAAEIAYAESSSSCKLLEATTPVIRGGTNDKAKDVSITGAWSSTLNDAVLSPSQPLVFEQAHGGTRHDEPPAPLEPMKRTSGVSKSKIADRLKAFEAVPPPPPPVPADLIPPPPPPPAAPAEEVKSKRKSKKVDIPGSFPDDFEEGHPDDIIEVIEMPVRTKKSSSKKSSKAKSDAVPIPIPPPPPAVPDAPILPPLEAKKESKKERPKINRDGGSSWGTWTATTPQKDKKASSKSKSVEEPKKARKERSPEKEDKLSSKGSSSDKAERSAKKDKDMETSRHKLKSVFASTPPISRSTSTREKRHKEGRSSRRPSIDVPSGLVSPPPEEIPEVGSKAAKILGIGLGRSASKRKNSLRPAEDDDIVMVGATDAESPEKLSRRRTSKSYHHDDDIVMVDVADASPAPGLKRSNTTGSTRKGFGGLFGGILSKPPAELKRRNTSHTDGEDAGAATDADAEARKAARRARRVEKEAAEKSKDEIRREKRRKQEEEAEAQHQADKEARRAERRAAREREADRRKVDEDKDERRRRKRAEREKEREVLETGAEDAEAEARRIRRERRKARAGESDTDADRRRRRTEKRSAREAEGRTPTRRRTEPVEDDFVYPRPTKISRRHTDGLAKSAAKAAEPPAWPHSGTSSWVKDHSDAGPPPDDGGMTTEVPEDGEGDEDAARRERRRRRRYGDVEVGGDDDRRRKRHEERSEGSDERRREKKGAMFAEGLGAGRASSGGFGGLWKKLTRN